MGVKVTVKASVGLLVCNMCEVIHVSSCHATHRHTGTHPEQPLLPLSMDSQHIPPLPVTIILWQPSLRSVLSTQASALHWLHIHAWRCANITVRIDGPKTVLHLHGDSHSEAHCYECTWRMCPNAGLALCWAKLLCMCQS